jgi:DNA-directed RNA polymerase specialized sigma24 family protein
MPGSTHKLKGAIPDTRWSLVLQAGGLRDEAGIDALNELLTLYLPVLKAHLVYQFRQSPSDAEDLVQAFVAYKVLQKNILRRADRSRGRFRNYLLKVFRNYVLNRLRREKFPTPESPGLNEDLAAIASDNDPTRTFGIRWAQQTINETLRRMRKTCESERLEHVWRVFELRIVGPMLAAADPPRYEDVVQELGFESPSQACNALVTAKRIFKRTLVQVVRDTVDSDRETDAEIRELRKMLAEASSAPEW